MPKLITQIINTMFCTYPHRRPTTVRTHISHLLTSRYLYQNGHAILDGACGRDQQNKPLKGK
tara:strand:+ start:360 stop:545 length:186 start_codon:yes stop_codon:yes gene_type:complete